MLPMLTVSGGPGLVYLNGRLCGETGVAAMPLAPDGVQYLELKPFDPNAPGAVLRLTLAGGRLVEGVTGDVYAVQWPGGWIAMELRGQWRDTPGEPRLISRLEMPGGQYLLVDEGGAASFGRDAEEAVFLPVEGVLGGTLRPHFFKGVCVAEGDCAGGSYVAVLRAEDAPEIIQCVSGASAHIDAQGVLHCTESMGDLVGHAERSVWTPDAQGNYVLRSRDPCWLEEGPRWPKSRADTARAFLDALCIGAWTEAAGYLSRADVMSRIDQVVGEFDAVIALPPDGAEGIRWGVLSLNAPNLASVRRLDFTFVEQPDAQGKWKIDFISEGI